MAEYIVREKVYADISRILVTKATITRTNYEDGWDDAICKVMSIIEEAPAADVRPERHGHIVWKERHSGGFRERKCLTDYGYSIFTPPCNRVARIDDRCTENRPYCSECGKLLGDFLSYCGNCGAKMDGKDSDNNDNL